MLRDLITQKILVLDGAMGTLIQQNDLTEEDYGGHEYDGCPEMLNVTRPDVITAIHNKYLTAGADIIETNTFGGTPIVLAEYNLEHRTEEFNLAAVKIAKEAAKAFSTKEKPRFVCGSIGPTTKAYSVTGGITIEDLEQNFYEQAKALIAGGADLLLLETCPDTINIKAGLFGISRAQKELQTDTPVVVSATIEPTGKMLAGQAVDALYASIAHTGIFSIGLNCATGPELMADHVRTLSSTSSTFINVCPNAGMPNEDGEYELTPQEFTKAVERFVDSGWVNIVGGCCGTTPEHIKSLAEMVQGKKPRTPSANTGLALSGIDYLEITPDIRPIIVGERTNVIGSRKFKDMISNEKFEEAAEVGRAQVKNGAQVVDICLGNPDRDERADMISFMQHIVNKVKVPLMIDTTDPAVMEEGLKRSQGKCVINSINLENGEERFQQIVPLAKKYGAALVVGTIDENPEQGMGVTRKRKLAIAERSYNLLVNTYKIRPEDIIFDPLVFPVGTGDENYVGAAEETIEGLRMIKEKFPLVSTALGVSNISFGLPPAGREVLNAVFLYHTTKAGLDFAIVNSEKLQRYAAISDHEKELADNLLFARGEDPLTEFVAFYKGKKVEAPKVHNELPLDERLATYVVEGSKLGLVEDLDRARETMAPLEIINGPLMVGMSRVGKLFNENQLIVAEVLQSAEVMRASVDHLKQFMDHEETSTKGKFLLATVKGDVHDIGKNLVDIILSNNGFHICNLGIKVAPETLIQAQKKENAHIIGLSGLLVKSAQQMVPTAEDLKNAGIDVPLIIGGAAITKRFVEEKIQAVYNGKVLYAKDAMNALALAEAAVSPEGLAELTSDGAAKDSPTKSESGTSDTATIIPMPAKVDIVPPLPFTEKKICTEYDLAELFSYVNPLMLFGKHLGLKGSPEKLLKKGDKKAIELTEFMDKLQKEVIQNGLIQPKTACRHYPAVSDGNDVVLFDPNNPDTEIARFQFPRQSRENGISLADYLLPAADGKKDMVALFACTAGKGIRDLAEKLKNDGEYLKSHAISALALETAEALAEYLHKQIRASWGFADTAELTKKDLFKAKFRGCRYSFGYPACPDLADQEKLFTLLQPEEIGIQLTEGFMMDPEASVSAIVFHHPEARYFSAP